VLLKLKNLSTKLIILLAIMFYPFRMKCVALLRKEALKPRDEAFIYIFYGHAGHLDELYFRHKRIEKIHFDDARNSCRNEFTDFLPRTYSRAPSRFFHRPNHHLYGFGS
jgi:hypothetical protein